jgi:hypothetical protein
MPLEPFLGCAVFPRRNLSQKPKRLKQALLRVPPPYRVLARRDLAVRRRSSHRLLSWAFCPFSTCGIGGPLSAGRRPARFGPPAGFGYPPDGLLPPRPRRPCFMPAALLGFTLRSLPLSQSTPTSPSGCTHMPFRLALRPSTRRRTGPPDCSFWASTLARVPCGRAKV